MSATLRRSAGGSLTLVAAMLALALAPRPAASNPGRLCSEAIQAAERAFDLPAGLLMAVALTETGRRIDGEVTPWPWSINAAGKGAWLDHRSAAIERTRDLQASGIESIDVGCMQVNLKWHKAAFVSLEAAFDPKTNVTYAARYLTELRAGSRDWLEAAGRYHSADPARAGPYRERLSSNWRAAQDDVGVQYAHVVLPSAPGQIAVGGAWAPRGSTVPLLDLAEARPREPLLGDSRRPLLSLTPTPTAGLAPR